MFSKYFLVTVFIALSIQSISGLEFLRSDFDLELVVKDTKIQLEKDHPELFAWYQRLAIRIKTNAPAVPEDLKQVRESLDSAKQRVYYFVNSPFYERVTNRFIETAVRAVTPVIRLVPIKELNELVEILRSDPTLAKYITQMEEELETVDVESEVRNLIQLVTAKGMLQLYSFLNELELGDL